MSPHTRTPLEDAQHDRRARERFVAEHLPTVRALAAHYGGLGVPFDDLVQEGAIGLLDAIDAYDAERGIDFETFARFQIRCAIRDALTQTSRLVRLPKRVVDRRRVINRTEAELAATGGHIPSSAELAHALDLPVEVVLAARETSSTWLSLDAPLDQVLADAAAADPESEAAQHDEASLLDAAVDALPERQRELVVRRFGLGCPPEDLVDVATSLHVSRQRARAIEQAALYTLRDRLDPPCPNNGELQCHLMSSSPTEASTARRRRSPRRSPRCSARTASRRAPNRR
jgi:RNA polymerase sigma factor (sigma-70 family)